jgi:hypothetical protein
MLKQLELLMDNPAALSVRNEIDMLTVRLQNIVSQLEDFVGFGTRKWLEGVVSEAYKDLSEQTSPEEELAVLKSFLLKIEGILSQVEDEDRAWYQFTKVAEQKANLIRAEAGLLEQQQGVIRADQAFMMIHSIMTRMKELSTPQDMLGIPQATFEKMKQSGATDEQIFEICREFGVGISKQLARYVRTLMGVSNDPSLDVDGTTAGSEKAIAERHKESRMLESKLEDSDDDEEDEEVPEISN